MNKGMEDIMKAMGGGEDSGNESRGMGMEPKKRKVYVSDDVYTRLIDSGEATDAESDLDDLDDMGEEPMQGQSIDPMKKLEAGKKPLPGDMMDKEDEEMPEGIELDGLDDDTDDSMLKKIGRLFGNNLPGMKSKMKRG